MNGILARLNILHAPKSFLGETPWATLSIALADAWQWTPFVVLLAHAALQTLPRDVEEAAHIDGAKAWQRFFHIKLPLLAPSLAEPWSKSPNIFREPNSFTFPIDTPLC